jgi:hypothetical protein
MGSIKKFLNSVSAWFGYGGPENAPKFLFYPEDLQLAAYDQESADEVNLHVELAHGWCSCGLKLEFAGIPLQAQRGHLMHDEPTSVFIYESLEGLKLQCQECLYEWPVFDLGCDHNSRTEPAHCHYCMHSLIERAQKKGCKDHRALGASTNPFASISKISKPGWPVYMWSCGISLIPLIFESLNLGRIDPTAWPRLWQIIAIIGAGSWLMGHYLVESDPVRSAKFKARAYGSWLWALGAIFIVSATNEVEIMYARITAALGLG